jgi:hypothetical protein
LPNLTSVKESKLSKHTIVDESLKYHEVQKAKLEDLQKTVDELKVEKEALLAELSGWRGCLDATPMPAAPADMLGANALGNDAVQIGSHDLMPVYDAIAIPGPVTTHEVPPMVPASFSTQADAQSLDNYALQTSAAMLAGDPIFNISPRTPQYHLTQFGTHDESHQHALWSAPQSSHMQQPLWPQPSNQELPLDFQRRQFSGQEYNLNLV